MHQLTLDLLCTVTLSLIVVVCGESSAGESTAPKQVYIPPREDLKGLKVNMEDA